MAKIEVKDSFLMGTENGSGWAKHQVEFRLWIGSSLMRLGSDEEIQAFATWVREAQQLMQDIAQQSHAFTTPSSEPTLFSCLGEEMDELRHAGSLK